MRWFRLLTALSLLLAAPLPTLAAGGTSARLLLPTDAARPGETILAGIELTMKPGWHTYWRNGGDSGAPTTVEWTLPAGLTAGTLRWPAPERLDEDGLITYVYHHRTLLLVPISIAPSTPPGPINLSAKIKWLECEKSCVPGGTTVQARLTLGNASQPSTNANLLKTAESQLPKPLTADIAQAAWDGPPTGDERPLVIRWRTDAAAGTPEFFADSSTTLEIPTTTDVLPQADGTVTLRKKVKRLEASWPNEVSGVLALLNSKHTAVLAFEGKLTLADGPTPPRNVAAATHPKDPAAETEGGVTVPRLSLGKALFLALIGGLILNIMPCVLPVIALKILGFVRQSGSRPAEIRKLGLIYGLGVWFSFLALAAVVIAVQKATGAASWGMQFGNPVFLVAMTSLVILVSLSLFGVFEIMVTGRAMDAAGDLASKEGPAGAFFNGMLAVALATPCTAPFLAPALGYAFTAPNDATIVIIFSAVAFGLASPYVVLSWQPAWLKFLPKPGAWMEHFKIAMGFPMLATAIWLYTLAADRLGPGGPLWLGLFLVGLALSAWVWGEFAQRGRRRPGTATAVAIVLLAVFYTYTLEKELDWRNARPDPSSASSETHPTRTGGIEWQAWSPAALASARTTGRPVLVDFTAEWCLTCKLNERSSLAIDSVREKLRSINAITLKGDHTATPPAITAELKRFGRAGVPLVLVYPRDSSKAPIVLPEVLTPGIVMEALDKAAL